MAKESALSSQHNSEPLVSTCILTYQHEPFISQAIDGALAQQCTFDYEIIICDDGSSDGTQEICRSYAAKYPDKIKLLSNDKNLGINANAMQLFMNAKGKYIAICEGDDFWVDSEKLQKQVFFMQDNPDYTITASSSRVINNEGLTVTKTTLPAKQMQIKDFAINNFLGQNTASIVFRKTCIHPDVVRILAAAPFLDWALSLVCLSQGSGFCFSDVMSVYRTHSQGKWTSMTEEQQSNGFAKMQEFIAREFVQEESETTLNSKA